MENATNQTMENATNPHTPKLSIPPNCEVDAFLTWAQSSPISVKNTRALLCPVCRQPCNNLYVVSHQTNLSNWKIELMCKRHKRYQEVHWFACKFCPNWSKIPYFHANNKSRHIKNLNLSLILHNEHHISPTNPNDPTDHTDLDICVPVESNEWNDSVNFLYNNRPNKYYCDYVIARHLDQSVKHILEQCQIVSSIENVPNEEILTFLEMVKELFIVSRAKREKLVSIFHGFVTKLTQEHEINMEAAKIEINRLMNLLAIEKKKSDGYRIQLIENGIDPRTPAIDTASATADSSFRALSTQVNHPYQESPFLVHTMMCAGFWRVLQISADLGLKFERNRNVNERYNGLHDRSHHHSPNVKLASEKFFPHVNFIPLAYWSDGAELGNSKTNRSNGKIATVSTLQHPMPRENVFLVAVGSSKMGNFNDVQSLIIQDLMNLARRPVKCLEPGVGGIELVRFGLTTIIQDRPEHDEFTGCVGHAGTFSKVPGYSFPLQIKSTQVVATNRQPKIIVLKDLMSCSRCLSCRLTQFCNQDFANASKSTTSCNYCNDWDPLQVTFRFTNKKDHPSYKTNIITGKKITFESMREALDHIRMNVFNGMWLHKYQSRNYAKFECVREQYADAVHNLAKEAREGGTTNVCPPIPNKMLPIAMQFDHDIKLNQCLVGVMHTVVLNGGKTTVATLKDLYSKRGKWTEAYENMNKLLGQVRHLSLSWVKTWTFGSAQKPGGPWVSENYLAFVVLSKAIISLALPILPIQDDRIILKKTIFAWNSLVSLILQPERVSDEMCNQVSSLAKIFLSFFAQLELRINNNSIKRLETTSSLISLIRVAEDMKLHGTQQNMWEGSYFGEGMFRVVKSHISRGLYCPGTAKSVLEKYYSVRELDSLISEIKMESGMEMNNDEYIDDESTSQIDHKEMDALRYHSFHSYKSLERVRGDIFHKDPVAVVYNLATNCFFVMIRKGRSNRYLHRMTLDSLIIINGMTCVDQVHICEEGVDQFVIAEHFSCLLLPMIGDNGQKFYFAINEHHKEYNFTNGKFFSPLL